jgi:hypothetical protein
LGGTYEARAINGHGAIAGDIVGGVGLFWPDKSQAPYTLIPPPFITSTLTPRGVTPTAVNDSNVVVGSYLKYGSPRAFRWTPAGGFVDITPLDFPVAVVLDIDDAGWMVGYGLRAIGATYRYALRWSPSGVVSVLNGNEADAINASGVAVGKAEDEQVSVQWPLSTTSYLSLAVPQGGDFARVDDISGIGRTVGIAPTARISPALVPWTAINGSSLVLPVPNESSMTNVLGLRVNSCGAITGRQVLTTGSTVGLLWTKLNCDYIPTRIAL